jgi:hypothetical protein
MAIRTYLKWRFIINAAITLGNSKCIPLLNRFPLLFHLSTDTSEKKNLSLDNMEKT